MESSNHDYSLSDSSWWIPWYGQWCPRGLCQLQLPARSCGLSIVNEDEHCPYTFAQSATRNCLHIMLTSTGCVAQSAAAVLWPEYAGSPWPGHHRPQAAQFTMTNISRIKLSQLSSLPISATLWLVLQTNNQRSCTITTVDMKLGRRCNYYYKRLVALRHYANQPACPLWLLHWRPSFTSTYGGSTPI